PAPPPPLPSPRGPWGYPLSPSSVISGGGTVSLMLAKAYRLAMATSCGTGYSQLKSSGEHSLGKATGASETVECVDLDRVLLMTGVDNFDFVKIDNEGPDRGNLHPECR